MSKRIDVTFPDGLRVDAHFNERVVITDQSAKNGGAASAPEPFQLFLASLATCAGIYALRFCQTRDIPTDGLRLSMHCDFDRTAKRYSHFRLELQVPPEFPPGHEAAIARSMDLCPVKKHIEDPPQMTSRVIRSNGD